MARLESSHRMMIGEKRYASFWVPKCCKKNRKMMIATEIPTIAPDDICSGAGLVASTQKLQACYDM